MIKKLITKLLILSVTFSPLLVSGTNAFFTSEGSVASNIVTTGCWVKPTTPTPSYPVNNSAYGKDSEWDKNPYLDWEDSETSCPLENPIVYYYESYRNGELTNSAYKSGSLSESKISAPGTPDGTYWWRVKAVDSFGYESDWSQVMKFTIDRQPPIVEIKSPAENSEVSETVEIKGLVTDKNPDYYELNIYNSDGDKVAGPGKVTDHSSFDNKLLFSWNTYTGATPDGVYTIELKATDLVGNYHPEISKDTVTIIVKNEYEPKRGDIVINEIMWMGSSEHVQDEWIELRNLTDENISLEGWAIEGAGKRGENKKLALSGTIPSNGFFLISYYQTNHDQNKNGKSEKAAINDSILADLVTTDLDLKNSGEKAGKKLTLKSSQSVVIDETPEPEDGGWVDGYDGRKGGNEEEWRSMERDEDPGDGSLENNWHTCMHSDCNSGDYWDVKDGQSPDYGTPKAGNSSEVSLTRVAKTLSIENKETSSTSEEQNLLPKVNVTEELEIEQTDPAETTIPEDSVSLGPTSDEDALLNPTDDSILTTDTLAAPAEPDVEPTTIENISEEENKDLEENEAALVNKEEDDESDTEEKDGDGEDSSEDEEEADEGSIEDSSEDSKESITSII